MIMIYANILLGFILLFISYAIKTLAGLNYRTYPSNKMPIFYSGLSQLFAFIIWIGLLFWGSRLLYEVSPIAFIIGLLIYFFVFNFFFLKRFIRYFGGDLVFPDSLKNCEGIIDAMVFAYLTAKNKLGAISEKELLWCTLKSRYPFMNNKKREAIIGKCETIRELIYEVLKIDLIDFDVMKSKPIKMQIDEIISSKLNNSNG